MIQKPRMPVAKDAHVVKIAVEFENHLAQLIEFNQRQPLSGIIQVSAIKKIHSDKTNSGNTNFNFFIQNSL